MLDAYWNENDTMERLALLSGAEIPQQFRSKKWVLQRKNIEGESDILREVKQKGFHLYRSNVSFNEITVIGRNPNR